MKRADHREKCPCPRRGAMGEISRHDNFSRIRPPKQEQPHMLQEMRSMSGNRPDGFACAFCGAFNPWRQMAAFDKRLKFCQTCHDAMDALDTGANDALAILREAVW